MRRSLLPLAVSALLVIYLLQRVALGEIAAAVGSVPAAAWAAALATYLAAQAISALRWRLLARAVGFEQSPGRFLRLYFEGMFFSLCLPTAVGGDVVKAVRLGHTAPQRLLAGWTILADRFSGLLALVAVGCGGAAQLGLHAAGFAPLSASVLGVLAGLGVLAATVAGWHFGRGAIRWGLARSVGASRRLTGVARAVEPYAERPGVVAGALGLALGIQLLNVAVVGCLGTAMGVHAPVVAYFILAPGVAVASMLPVSLGGIGVREASVAAVLAGWGVVQAQGVALGVVWFSVMMAAGLVGGGVVLLGGTDERPVAEPAAEEQPSAEQRKAA